MGVDRANCDLPTLRNDLEAIPSFGFDRLMNQALARDLFQKSQGSLVIGGTRQSNFQVTACHPRLFRLANIDLQFTIDFECPIGEG